MVGVFDASKSNDDKLVRGNVTKNGHHLNRNLLGLNKLAENVGVFVFLGNYVSIICVVAWCSSLSLVKYRIRRFYRSLLHFDYINMLYPWSGRDVEVIRWWKYNVGRLFPEVFTYLGFPTVKASAEVGEADTVLGQLFLHGYIDVIDSDDSDVFACGGRLLLKSSNPGAKFLDTAAEV